MGNWAVVKKNTGPPKQGCLGGTWSASTQEESEESKAVWEGQNLQGWRKEEEEGPGGEGAVWQLG